MKTPVNPLLQWLNMFFSRRSLSGADGRALYAYRCTDTEYDSLAELLRTYAPVVIQERYSFPIAMFYLAYMPQSLSAGLIRSDTLNGTQF